jgi:hypothetical protein
MRHFITLVLTTAACGPTALAAESATPLPDTSAVLDRIHAQMCAHDDAGALATAKDFFERSHTVPALSGVRDSYILGAWARIASAYPPARSAIMSIRDRDADALVAGDDIADAVGRGEPPNAPFVEIAAIDEYFGDERHAIALFKRLDEQKPKLAELCFQAVQEQLLAAGERQLCLKHLGDPLGHIDRRLQMYREMIAMAPNLAEEEKSSLRKQVDFIVAALAANDHLDDCRKIGQRADLQELFPDWANHVDRVVERHRDY